MKWMCTRGYYHCQKFFVPRSIWVIKMRNKINTIALALTKSRQCIDVYVDEQMYLNAKQS